MEIKKKKEDFKEEEEEEEQEEKKHTHTGVVKRSVEWKFDELTEFNRHFIELGAASVLALH